jgi:hypothetical protein
VQGSGSPVVIGSLFRSVTHSLLSNSRYTEAVALTRDTAAYLEPGLPDGSPEYLSVYGTRVNSSPGWPSGCTLPERCP